MRLTLAHRSRPYPGETLNGDAVWTGTWIHRPVIAVFDGSGHGPQAHEASKAACSVLDGWDGVLDLPALAERLHRDLRGSRGCAGTIAVLDGDLLRGFGVGNVQLRALGRTISALLTPGILGVRLRRKLRVFDIPLRVGDRLLMSSDGINARIEPENPLDLSLEALCDSLLRDHARAHDDATVLAAELHPDHE